MGLSNVAKVAPNFNTNATFNKPFEASAAGSAPVAMREAQMKSAGIAQHIDKIAGLRGVEKNDGGAVGIGGGSGFVGKAVTFAAGVAASIAMPGVGAAVGAGLAIKEAIDFVGQKSNNALVEYEGGTSFGTATDGYQPITSGEQANLDNYQCATGETYVNGWAQQQTSAPKFLQSLPGLTKDSALDSQEEKGLSKIHDTLRRQHDELAAQGARAAKFAEHNNETISGSVSNGWSAPKGMGAAPAGPGM